MMSHDGISHQFNQQLGMEVQHITGGCTSLCYHVNVGINRSLKTNIHMDWEDLMLDLGIIASATKPPTGRLMFEWVMNSSRSCC